MFLDDYKRWLEADLEDAALTEEKKRREFYADDRAAGKRRADAHAAAGADGGRCAAVGCSRGH